MSDRRVVTDEDGRAVRMFGYDIPDLRKLPRDQWHEALLALPRGLRTVVIDQAGREMGDELARVVSEVESPVYWRHRRALEKAAGQRDPALAFSAGGKPARRPRRGVQLGLRLGPGDIASLERAASGLGMKRCELARVLIVNGVNRLLAADEAADE